MILPPDPIEMDLTGYSHRWRILNLVSRAVLIEAQGTPGWVHLYKIRMLFGAYPNLSQEVDAAMSGRMVKVLVGSVRVAVRRRVRSPYDYAINPDRLPLLQRQLVQCDYWRAKWPQHRTAYREGCRSHPEAAGSRHSGRAAGLLRLTEEWLRDTPMWRAAGSAKADTVIWLKH